jgi:ornithine carbamoyltransferase
MRIKGPRGAAPTLRPVISSFHAVPAARLWSADALTEADAQLLRATARRLQQQAHAGQRSMPLRGRHLALFGPADALQAAAQSLGAQVTRLPADALPEHGDAVHLLGRLYDGIDCGAQPPGRLAALGREAGVPVYNGLGSAEHPVVRQLLREPVPVAAGALGAEVAALDAQCVLQALLLATLT